MAPLRERLSLSAFTIVSARNFRSRIRILLSFRISSMASSNVDGRGDSRAPGWMGILDPWLSCSSGHRLRMTKAPINLGPLLPAHSCEISAMGVGLLNISPGNIGAIKVSEYKPSSFKVSLAKIGPSINLESPFGE